jgi:hypothetical protein
MAGATFWYFCVNAFLAFLSVPQDVRKKQIVELDSIFGSL